MRGALAGVALAIGCAVGASKEPVEITAGTIASGAGDDSGGGTAGSSGEGGSDGGGEGSGSGGADSSSSDGGDGVVMGCGDSVVQAPETCDDGNDASCDGCEDCQALWGISFPGTRGNALAISDVGGSPLQLLDTPLTIEAWVRIEVGDRIDIIRRSPVNVGWGIRVAEDTLSGVVFGQFGHDIPGLSLTGAWHHVAWTYDQSSSRLFLDGTLLGIIAHTEPMSASEGPTTIGQWESGDGTVYQWWGGRIDEVRISKVARYESSFEPVRRFDPDPDTIWLAHMDEGTGITITDASSYAHNASLTDVDWLPDDGYGLFCG